LNSSSTSTEIGDIALAASFIVLAAVLGYRYIGLPPVIIVGGSGLIGLLAWSTSYLKRPTSPEIILPCFLLTVAALEVHMMEEYLTGFAPAMSRLFNITWTERGFLIVFAFVGPALYALTAIGLFYRIRFAGFLAWFIFIGPGVVEFTHFIFPLLKPAHQSGNFAEGGASVSKWCLHLRVAQLLHPHNQDLLLCRNVHRHPANDSGNLRNLQTSERRPQRKAIVFGKDEKPSKPAKRVALSAPTDQRGGCNDCSQ
jgi:hypothetical protein